MFVICILWKVWNRICGYKSLICNHLICNRISLCIKHVFVNSVVHAHHLLHYLFHRKSKASAGVTKGFAGSRSRGKSSPCYQANKAQVKCARAPSKGIFLQWCSQLKGSVLTGLCRPWTVCHVTHWFALALPGASFSSVRTRMQWFTFTPTLFKLQFLGHGFVSVWHLIHVLQKLKMWKYVLLFANKQVLSLV